MLLYKYHTWYSTSCTTKRLYKDDLGDRAAVDHHSGDEIPFLWSDDTASSLSHIPFKAVFSSKIVIKNNFFSLFNELHISNKLTEHRMNIQLSKKKKKKYTTFYAVVEKHCDITEDGY